MGLSTPHVIKYWELIGKEWYMMSYRVTNDIICAKTAHWFWSMFNIAHKQFIFESRHYCLNYSSIPEFRRKRSSLTVAQKTQNIWNFTVGKSSLQKEQLWRLSGRHQTPIWRPGDTVQNLESPGLYGRDDSTALQWVYTLMSPSPVTVIEKLVKVN